LVFALSLPVVAEDPLRIGHHEDSGELTISLGDRPLLRYAFAPSQYKPYVKELYSLAGDAVLRDAPADHLHHHGLMYAIRANGVNFWEERDAPGHQVPVKPIVHSTGRTADGRPCASITQLIHWVPEAEAKARATAPVALIIEERTLTLTVDAAKQEVALDWLGRFTAGPPGGGINLHGSNYNGLGLRFPEAWDKVATHRDSAGHPLPSAEAAANWSAVSHVAGGREVTVALFSSPRTQRGPVSFFSMVEPFTYLAATEALDQNPRTHPPGDTWSVRHLVVVYPGRREAAALDARWERWIKEVAK
jgi:hypothetical protein